MKGPVEPGYATLKFVLNAAYDQAAEGKGKERHANGKPFHKQPILEITRMVGTGYTTGQAMKKLQEANSMAQRGELDAAMKEALGAINYTAAFYIHLMEKQNKTVEEELAV